MRGTKGGVVSERNVFKGKTGEKKKRMCGNMENDGDGFGREEIVGRREFGVGIRARVFVCSNEVGENTVLAITDEIQLAGRGEKQ